MFLVLAHFLSKQVPVRGNDELGLLASAINKMTNELKKNIGRRQKAEDANQTKTLFLANVSHELRTPLGVVLGYIELMKDPKLTETERADYLNIIDQTGKNLNRIVNDILDISKVETGHIDLKADAFNLVELTIELERMLELKCQSRSTILKFSKVGAVPPLILADRDRLNQILLNLLNNALKFTENGSIEVTYSFRSDILTFEVRDTGIGIPYKFRDRLFKHFSQVDPDYSQNQEGAGLGLALSRGLARMMGGELALKESEPEQGTTFIFWINATAVKTTDLVKTSSSSDLSHLKGQKILVVDDALENQMLIKLFLTKEGVEVKLANNGKEAVEMSMAEDFDLILMDMQMPVLNGFDATKKLRELDFKNPIVAFTANAMKGDERLCFEVGCNAFLSKPVSRNNLLKTLAGLLQGSVVDSNSKANRSIREIDV